MILRLLGRVPAIVQRAFPERRLFIRSEDHTRFVRLSPETQLVAWSAGTALIGWGMVATAILLMDSVGASNTQDQAERDRFIYEDRLSALATERDQRAAEAFATRARAEAAQDYLAEMQSTLLAVGERRYELEAELAAAQATLRRTIDDREAARGQISALGADRPARPTETQELGRTLDFVADALAEVGAERDRLALEASEADRLAGELDLELRLAEEKSDEILGRVEDALAVSVAPLNDVFRAAGLDPEALIAAVQGGHSGEAEALVQIQTSTMGVAPAADGTLRANRILDQLDEINHYRVALERVPLAMPVRDSFRYTSPFGPRWGRMHEGVDMAGPVGTPVYATADGVVTFAGWQNGYGRIVIVEHEFGFETRYPHLNAIRTEVGQSVSRGEQVGDMGSSGRSTGSHLHYEVRVDGEAVDPMTFIRAGRGLL